jgi:lipoprotein-releasing system permease protein
MSARSNLPPPEGDGAGGYRGPRLATGFEPFVALRFLREGGMQTVLILAGASVGVAVIVFLSALIDGLQASLIDRTLGSQAHVVVRPPDEEPRVLTGDGAAAIAARVERTTPKVEVIADWRQLERELSALPGVVAVAPTAAGSAFAERGAATRSVALRGVEPESFDRIVDVSGRLVARGPGSGTGRLALTGAEAVVGVELARELGLAVGDKLRLTVTRERNDIFTVAGIFDLGNKDVNLRWVLVPLASAQTLLDLRGGISTFELKVDDVFAADRIADGVAARTGLVADSWMRLNAQMMVGLRSQDSSKSMIQFFVVIAVALGIASVLVVSVVQKSREIGILRAVGISAGQIRRIFLLQGLFVGGVGSVAGGILGAALALLFQGMARNPDGSPTFPVDLRPSLFVGAAAVAVGVGLVAAVFPARRAAALDPAQAIRHG